MDLYTEQLHELKVFFPTRVVLSTSNVCTVALKRSNLPEVSVIAPLVHGHLASPA